jgi:hypothetical protein
MRCYLAVKGKPEKINAIPATKTIVAPEGNANTLDNHNPEIVKTAGRQTVMNSYLKSSIIITPYIVV